MSNQDTPVTEQKLTAAFTDFEKKIDEKIETAIAQIVTAVAKSQENMATKDDIKNMATKDDIKVLNQKVDILSGKVEDVQRRVIDLEHDTPTQKEVNDLKKFVGFRSSS